MLETTVVNGHGKYSLYLAGVVAASGQNLIPVAFQALHPLHRRLREWTWFPHCKRRLSTLSKRLTFVYAMEHYVNTPPRSERPPPPFGSVIRRPSAADSGRLRHSQQGALASEMSRQVDGSRRFMHALATMILVACSLPCAGGKDASSAAAVQQRAKALEETGARGGGAAGGTAVLAVADETESPGMLLTRGTELLRGRHWTEAVVVLDAAMTAWEEEVNESSNMLEDVLAAHLRTEMFRVVCTAAAVRTAVVLWNTHNC